MDTKTLAAQLNGRSYCHEITKEEEAIAKAAGLVVAFGASDDLLELRGAICDELGAYEGQTVHLTKEGLLENECGNEDCPYLKKLEAAAAPLEIIWHDESTGPCWTFTTTIPHETFEILEDGNPYCRGIVFALKDVGGGAGRYRRKPVVVDAFRWTGGKDQTHDPAWIVEALGNGTAWINHDPFQLVIKTLEGNHAADPGDWIIRGVKGELYPCKPNIFPLIYEEA